jgi:hypothetical protein
VVKEVATAEVAAATAEERVAATAEVAATAIVVAEKGVVPETGSAQAAMLMCLLQKIPVSSVVHPSQAEEVVEVEAMVVEVVVEATTTVVAVEAMAVVEVVTTKVVAAVSVTTGVHTETCTQVQMQSLHSDAARASSMMYTTKIV